MKLVINKCFGGFTLSDLAHERLIELGIPYFDSLKNIPKNYNGLYITKSNSSFSKYYSNFDDYSNRNNPLLIQVIEELGEKASSWAGNLKIVEIPDHIEWSIDDYDGIETIHENHCSW